tara:strand:+ start:4218 stop:4706 length:489 start_codon:yes stop_codon:yes gene_type:complete
MLKLKIMSSKNKFEKDLEQGNNGEKIIMMYLFCQGMKFVSFNDDYRYDIKMHSEKRNEEVLFEIKTDVYAKDTGNIAIEIRYKGKPSGISHTEADWFIYWYRDIPFNNVWMIKVKDLKSLIKKSNFKIVNGGDDNQSQLVLIPRKKYKEYFKVDTIKTKKLL